MRLGRLYFRPCCGGSAGRGRRGLWLGQQPAGARAGAGQVGHALLQVGTEGRGGEWRQGRVEGRWREDCWGHEAVEAVSEGEREREREVGRRLLGEHQRMVGGQARTEGGGGRPGHLSALTGPWQVERSLLLPLRVVLIVVVIILGLLQFLLVRHVFEYLEYHRPQLLLLLNLAQLLPQLLRSVVILFILRQRPGVGGVSRVGGVLAGAVRGLVRRPTPLQRHPLGGEEKIFTGNLDARGLPLVAPRQLHGQEVVCHGGVRGLTAGTEWPLLEPCHSQAESLAVWSGHCCTLHCTLHCTLTATQIMRARDNPNYSSLPDRKLSVNLISPAA